MPSPKLTTCFGLVGLYLLSAPSLAALKADKTTINSTSGKATISVSFAKAVSGDLYVATPDGNKLYFFGDGGSKFSTDKIPFARNSSYVGEKTILTVSYQGIPPNAYSLYQVVVQTGKDPLDVNNWVDGIAGLSRLDFNINLPNQSISPSVSTAGIPTSVPTTAPVVTATPAATPAPVIATPVPVIVTPEPTATPIYSPAPCQSAKIASVNGKKGGSDDSADARGDDCLPAIVTPAPAPTIDGKLAYSTNCESCHGSNPKGDFNHVLKGKDPQKIRDAINNNKGGRMGILKGRLSDDQINAISTYLQSF